MFTPPTGSQIRIERATGAWLLTIPAAKGSTTARFGIVAFLLVWLSGWSAGGMAAMGAVSNTKGGPDLFILIWLVAWALGWVLAVCTLINLVRPSVDETLVIGPAEVLYDSGRKPMTAIQSDTRKGLTRADLTRQRLTFPKNALRTVKLRETENSNRLTIDIAGDRTTIARGASEIEREWLAEVLSKL